MQPLAERLRPKNLDHYVGQEHILGKGASLRKVIENGNIPSMILWGPPGVGKTTIAKVIANSTERVFYQLSAINAGVKDIRATLTNAKKQQFFNQPNPILFIDEIHRFSKSQQDSLLGSVEDGTVTLIGATTENPSFEVISALLSRCQVYTLKHLEKDQLVELLNRAVKEDEIFSKRNITLKEPEALLKFSGGDARKLYNCLELVVNQFHETEEIILTNELAEKVLQDKFVLFDKQGEMHYDLASAFIKSIRGSDPNAAVYYLARMIEGGEDPKFICRRMLIAASEDIGLANPNALLIANNTFQAIERIGMPEGRIVMSQCAIYLASSPKSNTAYAAIKNAQSLVRETGNLNIPLHLRNAPTQLMKQLDYGKDYLYSHNGENNFQDQEFLPKEISGNKLYEIGNNAAEAKISDRLRQLWKNKYNY
jgi:putative ATPase